MFSWFKTIKNSISGVEGAEDVEIVVGDEEEGEGKGESAFVAREDAVCGEGESCWGVWEEFETWVDLFFPAINVVAFVVALGLLVL